MPRDDDGDKLAQDTVELSLDTIATPEGLLALGTMAMEMLAAAGTVTFAVAPGGGIKLVAPTQVLILEHEDLIPADKVPVLGRPITSEGRPTVVTIRDGIIYEVEFEDLHTHEGVQP